MLLASSYSLADFDLPEFNGFIAGAITQDNLPYANVDIAHNPSVLILGRLGDVFIEGNRAGYPLKRLGWGTLSALGQIRNHQYLEADDSVLINEDRKRAVELGPQLSVPLGGGYVSQFTLFQDISGAHESQEFEASVYKRWNIDKLQLVGTLAAQYQTQDLMNYYVGTDNYEADSELTSEIELLATYDITRDWSAIAVWRYYKHGSDFKNSPLTDGDTTQRVAIGIGRFF
jgi:outer membrane protein